MEQYNKTLGQVIFDEIDEDYDGDVIAWAEDKGYLLFGDYVVINLGL